MSLIIIIFINYLLIITLMLHKLMNKYNRFSLFRYLYHGFFRLYCDHVSDYVMISFPKSGHTWLRVMLAKAFSLHYGLSSLNLDLILMAKEKKGIPKIAIYHEISPLFSVNFSLKNKKFLGSYAESEKVFIRTPLKKKKIIFLVRDPRDVVVSLFFHLTKRNNFYFRNEMSHFLKEPFSLTKILNYMNLWCKEMQRRPNEFLFIRYEDMKTNTAEQLRRVLDFLEINVSYDILNEAVAFGSIDNMRKMEKCNLFADYRLQAKNPSDPESYKVRKAKVGGYTDYLNPQDLEYINLRISKELNSVFGY